MKRSFFGHSLFVKLFVLIFFSALIPIGVSAIYFLYFDKKVLLDSEGNISLMYYGLIFLTVVLSAIAAYYFSKSIIQPITHFIQSATEIARGNFSRKVPVESEDEIGRLAKIFNYMVKELRRLDEMNLNKIINEKNKTETILKNIADGVIVADPQNRIVLFNFVAENWFDLGGKDIVGKPIQDVVRNEALSQFISETAHNHERVPQSIEIALESREGWKTTILQARAARIVNEKGKLVGIVAILRDVTREKEIDQLKTELVSMVAHELRSPLTCISGFSELLLDPAVTREQAEEYASIIMKESNRLSDLINKFLDISKIESGKSQVRKSPVDMKLLVEKVLDFNGQLAEKKHIRLNFEAPAEVSLIHVDRDMMEQVILNLFSNAVKYSPENAEVSLKIIENDENLVVQVADTGYGISEKALPHIFEKFYRITDNENVQDIMGSGLGLALVKEIVEIHGGKIQVESKLGEGSTFTVTLPKTESVEEDQQQERMLV